MRSCSSSRSNLGSVCLSCVAETEPGSCTGAFCGSCINRNSICEHRRSALWLLQQQEQCPAALQERTLAPAAADTASVSVPGTPRERSAATAAEAGSGASYGWEHPRSTSVACYRSCVIRKRHCSETLQGRPMPLSTVSETVSGHHPGIVTWSSSHCHQRPGTITLASSLEH